MIILSLSYVSAATYYISPSGNNSNNGSIIYPWATFQYALGRISAGDTLILKDGVYRQTIGGFFQNQPYNSYSCPNGNSGAYTIIKAENDGKAVLQDGYIYLGGAVNGGGARGSSYVQIEGLRLNHSYIEMRNSSYIKLLRIGIKNGAPIDSRYGTTISVAQSNHVLLEDVWTVGSMRYGIVVYESYKVILRRVVARFDGNTEREPKSGICFYGAVDTITGANTSLCQNCIVLDYNPANGLGSGIQNVHSAKTIGFYGSIALNIPASGFVITEDGGSKDNSVINSVIWNVTGTGIQMRDGDPTNVTMLNQITVGNSDQGVWQGSGSSGTNTITTIKNSVFLNNLQSNTGGDLVSYNWFYPASQAQGSNYLTTAPNLLYITRTTDNNTGENGFKRGATIEKRYGVSGTLWDEPGYDILTNENLWPFPNEARIKADFAERDNFTYPSFYYNGNPYNVVNNPKRGFAADGNGLYGGNITLTSYIWEYLGNPCPAEICNYTQTNQTQNQTNQTVYHEADLNQNSYLEMTEIISYVRQFKLGTVTRTNVLDGVMNFFIGRYR